jgi:hypothetical protein
MRRIRSACARAVSGHTAAAPTTRRLSGGFSISQKERAPGSWPALVTAPSSDISAWESCSEHEGVVRELRSRQILGAARLCSAVRCKN